MSCSLRNRSGFRHCLQRPQLSESHTIETLHSISQITKSVFLIYFKGWFSSIVKRYAFKLVCVVLEVFSASSFNSLAGFMSKDLHVEVRRWEQSINLRISEGA